jgi:hypothetical protein
MIVAGIKPDFVGPALALKVSDDVPGAMVDDQAARVGELMIRAERDARSSDATGCIKRRTSCAARGSRDEVDHCEVTSAITSARARGPRRPPSSCGFLSKSAGPLKPLSDRGLASLGALGQGPPRFLVRSGYSLPAGITSAAVVSDRRHGSASTSIKSANCGEIGF